jgi:hypothetical protein
MIVLVVGGNDEGLGQPHRRHVAESSSWPALAENSRNGAMKTAPISTVRTEPGEHPELAGMLAVTAVAVGPRSSP